MSEVAPRTGAWIETAGSDFRDAVDLYPQQGFNPRSRAGSDFTHFDSPF